MPSPVGHTLAGLAAAFFTSSLARFPSLSPRVVAASVAVAVAPDLDLLVRGTHRTYTHSIGASVVVAAVSWLMLRRRSPNALAASAAITAAHASHLLVDWLSKDTASPSGLTILWPFSSTYFISGVDLFGEISRRYWLLDEFVLGNLKAAAWELFLLVPIALLAWIVWSGRTLTGVRGKG
jgi:membrane-bound metal-dependent hydrolase YbcI (DUF457 family)